MKKEEIYGYLGEKHENIGINTLDESLKIISRHYRWNIRYQYNCQRAVPAMKMRLRGYDVVAKPCKWKTVFQIGNSEKIADGIFSVWEEPRIDGVSENGYDFIKEEIEKLPDESRVQIELGGYDDRGKRFGHTIMGIKLFGKVLFIDPQTGKKDASYLFNYAEHGYARFCRIDDLEPNEMILLCCKPR